MSFRVEMQLMADESGLGRVLGVIRRRRFLLRELHASRPGLGGPRLHVQAVVHGDRSIETLVKHLANLPIVVEVRAERIQPARLAPGTADGSAQGEPSAVRRSATPGRD